MRLYDIPSYDPNTYWPQFSADNCFEETLPLASYHIFKKKKTPRNIKMSAVAPTQSSLLLKIMFPFGRDLDIH